MLEHILGTALIPLSALVQTALSKVSEPCSDILTLAIHLNNKILFSMVLILDGNSEYMWQRIQVLKKKLMSNLTLLSMYQRPLTDQSTEFTQQVRIVH